MRPLSLSRSRLSPLLFGRPRKRRLALALAASLLAAAGGVSPWSANRAHGADEPSFGDALQQQMTKLLDKCRQSVVRVEAVDAHSPISGTGFFIDANGTLLTSYTLGGGDTHDVVVKCG